MKGKHCSLTNDNFAFVTSTKILIGAFFQYLDSILL